VPIPPHMKRLRELVGTELLLVPSVAALVRDEDGRVLLVQISERGEWTLPGGLLEPDERPEDAAAREAHEEAGVELEVGAPIGVFGGPEFRYEYSNGDEIAFMLAVFAAEIRGGELRADGEETSAVGWFTSAELRDLPLTPRARTVLEQLL
jgi:ADP-ribose pyrophosphatase YjhB (NUDIX family)